MKLHIGCGFRNLPGYKHFDIRKLDEHIDYVGSAQDQFSQAVKIKCNIVKIEIIILPAIQKPQQWKQVMSIPVFLHNDDCSRAYLPHMDFENGRLMSLNVVARKR